MNKIVCGLAGLTYRIVGTNMNNEVNRVCDRDAMQTGTRWCVGLMGQRVVSHCK